MWAALGKAAAGAVKGKAKKIASDKLLNRKKKTDARRASAQKIMGQDSGGGEEKGGAIVKAQISPLPLAKSTEAIGKTPAAGGGEGGSGEIQGTLLKIKTSVIAVDTLLKGSYTLQQKQIEQQRASAEKADDASAEKDLEKDKKKKGGPNVGRLVPKQVKSLWAKLLDFFTGIILGWVAVRMVDFLPALMKAVPVIAGAIDWIAKIAVFAVNVLGTFVDGAYKFVNFMQGMVKGAFGEEAANKFGIFMENLKNLFQGFLVWKLIGEKIFKALINNIKNVWKVVTGFVRKAWVGIRRMMGRTLRKFFANLAKRGAEIGKNVLKGAGNIAKNVGGKILNAGKGLLSKFGGGAAGKVGGLAAKFLGPAAKTLGPIMKAVGPGIKKFAGRIPILGPIIVGVVSIMSGEPIGQAIFKTLGAALGGGLGATLAAAFAVGTAGIGAWFAPAMTMLGELLGTFVGDLLYELFLGGGWKAALDKLKGALSGVWKLLFGATKAIFNFFKNGFSTFIDTFPMVKFPETGIGSMLANVLSINPIYKALLNWKVPDWKVIPKAIRGFSLRKLLDSLPSIPEMLGFVFNLHPLLKPLVKDGKVEGMPAIWQLANPVFMVKHLASSFFGIGKPEGKKETSAKSEEGAAGGEKSEKEQKAEEKERKKEEAKKKREEIKKKIGDVAGKVGGFFKNIGKGILGGAKKLAMKHPSVMAAKAMRDSGGLRGLFSRPKKDSQIFPKISTSDKVGGKISKRERDKFIMSETPRYNDSKANALWEKADNNAGIGQLEQFAFYENPEGGGVIIKEVPIPVGAGAGAPPAEESAPINSGGGKSVSPFVALYRGDG